MPARRSADAGGPCCGMAAFAAMREGAPVRIFEKSAFPRHKVRGEFLSPAILPLLRRAGCEAGFLQLRPAVLSAMRRHFGTRVIRHPLPAPLRRQSLRTRPPPPQTRRKRRRTSGSPALVCRRPQVHRSSSGDRLFGFKAHFSGPVNDNVELGCLNSFGRHVSERPLPRGRGSVNTYKH